MKRHPENERVKRRYLQFLKEVKGRDEASLDAVAKALARFDEHSKFRDFRKFHIEQARAFKTHLMEQRNVRTGQPLSASTVHSTLGILKAFFIWLAGESEYRSRIKYSDAEYFNPPENLSRVATAHRYAPGPTLDQIRSVLGAMPASTDIQLRDRALIAFTLLTGARDRAIVSFKLKHVDVQAELLQQDAREVRTKRAKTFTTWFFPVGDDVRKIVVDWIKFLRVEKGFGPDDPIFPASLVVLGPDQKFEASSLSRNHWSNANPVRIIFKEGFARAGQPYFNPHSFRKTLVQLAYDLDLSLEPFKAWSQNLGHESCLTTFVGYGTIAPARQGEIIRGLGKLNLPSPRPIISEVLRQIADQLERKRSGAD